MTDSRVLQRKIESSNLSLERIAEILNISKTSLNKKLQGTKEFMTDEVIALRTLLNLSEFELLRIFFND